jgi:hypothetical protein
VQPGTELATVSFVSLAVDTAVKEVHPPGDLPLWNFEERIMANRRRLRVAREEVALLGFDQDELVNWPREDTASSGYSSEVSPLSSEPTTPSVPPEFLKQEQFPWNYSWGKGHSII